MTWCGILTVLWICYFAHQVFKFYRFNMQEESLLFVNHAFDEIESWSTVFLPYATQRLKECDEIIAVMPLGQEGESIINALCDYGLSINKKRHNMICVVVKNGQIEKIDTFTTLNVKTTCNLYQMLKSNDFITRVNDF